MDSEIIFSRPEYYIGMLTGIVTVPEDFDPEKESLPVILFLHGAGERGQSTPETVDKVKVHGIPKYFSKDPAHRGLRVITLSPQCPEGFVWDQVTFQLAHWLEEALVQFNGDRQRVSVTGISMGGYGTWNIITTFPELFFRAAPICGGGISWRARDTLAGKELRVYHSTDDTAVPFTCSVDMVQRAEFSGAKVSFTAFCGEGHGCWEKAYEQTDLIEWLAGAV